MSKTDGRMPPTPAAREAVKDEYARLAGRYEERWGRYVRATNGRTLARLLLRPGEVLLDVGCGTGALLREARREVPALRATGLDLSAAMLWVARAARPATAPPTPLVAADAAGLPLRAESADAVVSVSSFHFWPDPEQALAEIVRVLKPGGRLVITDWCADFWACRLLDLWLGLGGRRRPSIYRSQACRDQLERSGLHVESLETYRVGWIWGMVTATARKGGGHAACGF